ncbi:MAG: hypothetical protein ACO20X_13910 [Alphaproteobacteria bacterium]
MTKRNTPPPSTPNKGVANTNTLSHRERDDDYTDIVVQLAQRYRVIRCPQGLQWIIQEKEASHEGPWRAEGYYATHDSLLNACGKLGFVSDPNTEAVLHALPDHVSQVAKK